mmetsp:Transcript_19920/g.32787  ORF Transcript_19920/g.32787 Transcript_19920/m.32787 type:complete len:291 (-) Transcript_19920:1370-2242(-)
METRERWDERNDEAPALVGVSNSFGLPGRLGLVAWPAGARKPNSSAAEIEALISTLDRHSEGAKSPREVTLSRVFAMISSSVIAPWSSKCEEMAPMQRQNDEILGETRSASACNRSSSRRRIVVPAFCSKILLSTRPFTAAKRLFSSKLDPGNEKRTIRAISCALSSTSPRCSQSPLSKPSTAAATIPYGTKIGKSCPHVYRNCRRTFARAMVSLPESSCIKRGWSVCSDSPITDTRSVCSISGGMHMVRFEVLVLQSLTIAVTIDDSESTEHGFGVIKSAAATIPVPVT